MPEEPKEFTFLRFEVELNVEGFPADEGQKLANVVSYAIWDAVRKFDKCAKVKETTE